MSIGNEIGGGTGLSEQGTENLPMLFLFRRERGVVHGKPGVNFVDSRIGIQWSWKYVAVGGDAEKSNEDNP